MHSPSKPQRILSLILVFEISPMLLHLFFAAGWTLFRDAPPTTSILEFVAWILPIAIPGLVATMYLIIRGNNLPFNFSSWTKFRLEQGFINVIRAVSCSLILTLASSVFAWEIIRNSSSFLKPYHAEGDETALWIPVVFTIAFAVFSWGLLQVVIWLVPRWEVEEFESCKKDGFILIDV